MFFSVFIFIFILFFSKTYSWVINDYTVKIKIEPDSELKITEKLVVDFGKEKNMEYTGTYP